jgi:hypothetical protein
MVRTTGAIALLAALAVAAVGLTAGGAALHGEGVGGAAIQEAPYEVWVVDQSDTVADGGGTLYVYDGRQLGGQAAATATPEKIDLGGAARSLCLTQTGSAPRRPHMLAFNRRGDHGILAFVATGHVLFIDGRTRAPLACIDVGAQAHAAMPAEDESYVLVANQNGKLLQRITTSYSTNTFTLDAAATLDLASCTTPSGARCEDPALRPDNAPICPAIESGSRFAFVTLRGGGLLIVDAKATPMKIVAEYDRTTVHANGFGCGGAMQTAGKVFINSGGGTAANPVESDLYSFPMSSITGTPSPPNTPAPKVVFSRDGDNAFVDSHGAVMTKQVVVKKKVRVKTGKRKRKPRFRTVVTKQGPFLWIGDRAANLIVVVDPRTSAVIAEIPLAGAVSSDPTPDLMAISPSGNRVFITFRGPAPLTGNVPGVNNAVGATPGVAVVRVEENGRRGTLQTLAPISNVVAGVETADPHAVAVRRK